MKRIYLVIIVLSVGALLVGCGNASGNNGSSGENNSNKGATGVDVTGNPDAEEILSMAPDANIFQYDDLIYETGIDWVEEKPLTKDKQVGEIKETRDKGINFKNGTANKLPVGSKIFTTKEESKMFLLVESEGKILKYYALVEG